MVETAYLHYFTDKICCINKNSASCEEYIIDKKSNAFVWHRTLHYDEWLLELGRKMAQNDTVQFFSNMQLQKICKSLEKSNQSYCVYIHLIQHGQIYEYELKSFLHHNNKDYFIVCLRKMKQNQTASVDNYYELQCLKERFQFMLEHTVEDFIEIQVSSGNCVMYHRENGMQNFNHFKEQIAWWAENFIVPEQKESYIAEFDLENLLNTLRKQNGYHQCAYDALRKEERISLRIVSTLRQRKWGKQEEYIYAYAQDITTEKEHERKNKQLVDISQQLLNLSQREPVTGLYNRAAGQKFIEEYLDIASHAGTLLLLDIDNFKSFNDVYGHQTGDYVLKFLAKSLQDVFRSDDILCRWGGDEFIIFMRDICRRQNIESRIERLRARIRLCRQNEQLLEITVSIGGVIANEGIALKDLFERCDKQLYLVKENGRDGFQIENLQEGMS